MKYMVNLCRGRRGKSCCPTLEKTGNNEYIVRDDKGGSVELSYENIDVMYNYVARMVN